MMKEDNVRRRESRIMRVLVQACSSTKIDTIEPVAALDRYDGSPWRVVRKYLREHSEDSGDLLILALSAEFGLVESSFAIPDYNRRMDKMRASELAASVADQWRQLATGAGIRPREIMINVGADYLPALAQIDFSAIGNVKFAAGGIGERGRADQALAASGSTRKRQINNVRKKKLMSHVSNGRDTPRYKFYYSYEQLRERNKMMRMHPDMIYLPEPEPAMCLLDDGRLVEFSELAPVDSRTVFGKYPDWVYLGEGTRADIEGVLEDLEKDFEGKADREE